MEQLDQKTLQKLLEYKSKVDQIKLKIKEAKIEKLKETKFELQERLEKNELRKELEKARELNIKERERERNLDARNRWLSLKTQS